MVCRPNRLWSYEEKHPRFATFKTVPNALNQQHIVERVPRWIITRLSGGWRKKRWTSILRECCILQRLTFKKEGKKWANCWVLCVYKKKARKHRNRLLFWKMRMATHKQQGGKFGKLHSMLNRKGFMFILFGGVFYGITNRLFFAHDDDEVLHLFYSELEKKLTKNPLYVCKADCSLNSSKLHISNSVVTTKASSNLIVANFGQ